MDFDVHMYIGDLFPVLGHSEHTFDDLVFDICHSIETSSSNIPAAGWVLDRQCWYKCNALGISNRNETSFQEKIIST